jgi:hypothetical protein
MAYVNFYTVPQSFALVGMYLSRAAASVQNVGQAASEPTA